MPVRDQLLSASFKGFDFLVQTITTTSGQKTAVHDFVNSSARAVEDLGRLPETFNVNAIISPTSGAANYRERIRRFSALLSEGGSGQFVHPALGQFTCKVTRFVDTYDESESGFSRFNIELERVDENDLPPLPSDFTASSISTLSSQVIENSGAMMADSIISPISDVSRADLFEKIDSLSSQIDGIITRSQAAAASVRAANATISFVVNNLQEIATAPLAIARTVVSLIDTVGELADAPETVFQQYQNFFGFGSDDVPTPNNTVDFIAREQNRNIINAAVRSAAFARAHEASSLVTFGSVSQLETTRRVLGRQFKVVNDSLDKVRTQNIAISKISSRRNVYKVGQPSNDDAVFIDGVEQQSFSPSISGVAGGTNSAPLSQAGQAGLERSTSLPGLAILSSLRAKNSIDTLSEATEDLQSASSSFFNTQRIITPQIIEIDLPIMPASVASYLIYGDSQFADALLSVNQSFDSLKFGGPATKVISS